MSSLIAKVIANFVSVFMATGRPLSVKMSYKQKPGYCKIAGKNIEVHFLCISFKEVILLNLM